METTNGPLDSGPTVSIHAQLNLPTRFHALFAGFEAAHGTYTVGDTQREDGKLEGRAVTVRNAVTDHLWKLHLEGKQGLGIIPIREDDTCVFGAIDVDVYADLDHGRIAATVARLALPLLPCRSKSGGIHLYLFTSEPVPASQVQKKLREMAALLGFGTSEIFPKQGKVLTNQGDLGSWINAVYFGGDQTTRYAVRPNGDAMTAAEFLEAAEAAKVGPGFFAKQLPGTTDATEFKDAPPCLANLVQIGFPEGQRNDGLYNISILLKRRFPDEWEKRLHEYNELYMRPPLSSTEVQGVIGSFKKGKSYQYKCSQSPLVQHCNAGVCRTRKYGVGGGAGSIPDFGALTKQEGDETVWFWALNHHRVRLSTADLLNQRKFRERCADAATIVVPMMKQNDWDGIVARAMENAEIIPCTEDTTKAGELWELVEKYCVSPQATCMDEVLEGSLRPFDGNDGRTYFRLSGLAHFLKRNQFRDMERGEIGRVITQRGGQHHFSHLPRETGEKRKGRNYWSVPTPTRSGPLAVPAVIRDPGSF